MSTKTAMSDETMQVAIAEACGWRMTRKDVPRHVCPFELMQPDGVRAGYGFEEDTLWKLLAPKYLTSLDAMHEAEAALNEDDAVRYWCTELPRVVGAVTDDWMHKQLPKIAGATARQRAQAFLATILRP